MTLSHNGPITADDWYVDKNQYARRQRSFLYRRSWLTIVENYGRQCVRCGNISQITAARVGINHPPARRTENLEHLQPLCRGCANKGDQESKPQVTIDGEGNEVKVWVLEDYRPDKGLWVRENVKGSGELF